MTRNKLAGLLGIMLLALALAGCSTGTMKNEQHGEAMESASFSGYTGSFSREVIGNEGQNIVFHIKLSTQNGHILLTIVDCNGDPNLSLNEHATLDESGAMFVTVPSTGCPYVFQADMEHFTGEYGVSWGDQTESIP